MNVDLLRIIERSELRVMLCDSCGEPCLAAKRSLCCGDSVRQIADEWAWYQEVKPKLGKADWQWDDEWQHHIPCCSQPKGTWRCGNGPLVGDAILTGDCGEHPPITPITSDDAAPRALD